MTPGTMGGGGKGEDEVSMLSPLHFCLAERKKGNKGKKQTVSKEKQLKDYHHGQNVGDLAILERQEFKSFPCWPTMVADNTFQCSMTPPI